MISILVKKLNSVELGRSPSVGGFRAKAGNSYPGWEIPRSTNPLTTSDEKENLIFAFVFFLVIGIIIIIMGIVGESQGEKIRSQPLSLDALAAQDAGFVLDLLPLFGSFIVVGALLGVGSEAVKISRARQRRNRNQEIYEKAKSHINDRYCVYCDYPIGITGSTFCPNCGATLITIRGDTDTARIQSQAATNPSLVPPAKTLGTCPVCRFVVQKDAPVASCPHCGTLAHRDHFLEYLHVHDSCPSCGKHLNEKEIRQHLARANARIESKKKSG